MKWMVKMSLLVLPVLTVSQARATDSIIVKKDARLDILTAKQALVNKRTSMLTSSGQYKGFRVQVISTRTREDAFKTKTFLLTSFPEYKTYVMYQSPNFKVRIGNFIRKEDADKFKKQLAYYFPQGVYIVEDAIEYTATEEDEFIPQ